MEYKIDILLHAKIEIIEATEYYQKILDNLSNELLIEFYSHLDIIAKDPFHYQVFKKPYRKLNLSRFPYKIIYMVEEYNISIVAFAHHKRKPNYWKKR